MSYTTAQLAARVLERLKVTMAGETASAEDAATVENYYAGVFAEETVNGLFYWDADDIPTEAFEALVDLIATNLASDFGMPPPTVEISGRTRLRTLATRPLTGLTVTGSYF